LENLPIWNNNQSSSAADNPEGVANQEDQSLVIAIQTPHGSHLNIYHQRKAEQPLNRVGADGNCHSHAEVLRDTYHLEIDAETGREGLPSEHIKIYQVDAPDQAKKGARSRPNQNTLAEAAI